MSISELKGSRVPVKIWSQLETVESTALDQLKRTASLPWVVSHVAAMPDVHYGIGATVGSVIATEGAVCPAAVGVDIGCGMTAVKTNLTASDLPDSLADLRLAIEAAVPVGHMSHEGIVDTKAAAKLFQGFSHLHAKVQDLRGRAAHQLGTLGGGNHFIEVCLDQDNTVWLMLHSGSRNIGKVLAEIHIGIAKTLSHNATLPDKDLAAFLSGTEEMAAYRSDLHWAQEYAALNRRTMLSLLLKIFEKRFPNFQCVQQPISCHHNYVSEETHFGKNVFVTRKGAIAANQGQLGIIPGSMGTRSYIVEGLGNPDSFCSASHGAGRRMSRGAAKKAYGLEDLEAQTSGVECRKDFGVLDEIPGAYKDIDQVMYNQRDLVRIVATIKQILCVKG